MVETPSIYLPPLPEKLDPPRLTPTCLGAGKKPRSDGACSICGGVWKLRKDGTVRIHRS